MSNGACTREPAAFKATPEAGRGADGNAALSAGSSRSGAMLIDPSLDGSPRPDPAGGKLADRLGKARGSGELVGSLLGDAQEGGDLCDSYEFHRPASYPLTTSSVKRYSALDNVKREDNR